jgi:hypothetical protein
MDTLISQFALERNVFIPNVYGKPFGYIRTSACIHLATPF